MSTPQETSVRRYELEGQQLRLIQKWARLAATAETLAEAQANAASIDALVTDWLGETDG